jgi:hypothetical protein
MSFIVHRVAKSAARYTDAGGREKCGYCRFFVPPRSCGKVIGPVSPMGWCKHFSRQMVSQFGGSTVTSGIPAGATLSLDFLSSGNMPAGITFTRASTATYTDASGVIQTAAINAPRWDYAGGSLRGLLIEEARTNLFLNSATLVTQGVTVTATAYTLSFYGSGTVTKSGTATGALVGTGAGQRVTQTFTPSAGTLTCTVTGSVTNAQIEAGGFVTSWISTAGGAATRAQDVPIIASGNMAPWFTPPGGSWFIEFIQTSPGSNNRILAVGGGASGKTMAFAGPGLQFGQYDGATPVNTVNIMTLGAVQKGVTTFSGSIGDACLNGGAVATVAMTTGYAALSTNGVRFFSDEFGTGATTGWLRRLSYWPRALSDAEKQAVTA